MRALALVGLVPLVALTLVLVTSARHDLEGVARANLADQARLQAAAVSSVLDQAGEAVAVLAANPALRNPDATSEEIRDQLEAYSLFEEVTLLHPAGVVIEATSYGFAGRWDANATFRAAMLGQPVMSQPLFYPAPERLVVEHAAPVVKDGAVIAVVVGTMNMDRVWRALDSITIGRSGFFAAFDQYGNVISFPDKSLVLSKLDGYPLTNAISAEVDIRAAISDRPPLIGHAVPVASTGWHVAALQSEAEAYALADDSVSRVGVVGALALLIAISGALVLSRTISSPIRNVGAAMRRITAGDLEQRVTQPGLEEIDQLAQSFNVMAGDLAERSESLQLEMVERDRAEQKIRYQAHHDPLTGLPNRTLLKDRLDMAQADSRRTGEPLAVMFLDLDRFKLVNDSVGHSFGDELLLGVSDRITAELREGDSVARVGGDEYVLLLPRVSSAERAMEAARRIMEALRAPWNLNGREFRITASIGLAMFPGDGKDAEALLRNADTAMYKAKDDGRNDLRRFTADMDKGVQDRVALEHELRRALELGQFVLHYQPQVQTDLSRVVGLEALLRWQSPGRGLVAPGRFIPLAEETGLIWDIGRWVLRTACAQMQSWRAAGLMDAMPVAVNVSPRQFHDLAIVDEVRMALADSGLPSSQLELEITESTAMRDVEHSVRTLTQLKEMGVRVSIDDFGTGYSSLSYLKRFPVDTVKIDRSFVMDIDQDPDDAAIVAAIIALAASLKMRTVAEGVETKAQLAFLADHDCSSFQGFIFSRALPADDLIELLAGETPSKSGLHGRTSPAIKLQLAPSV